jgi:hypothetical protein
MKKGYIKLYRKLLENPMFKNAELLQLFLYCLLKANREPGKAFYGSNEIDVGKGQFITGRFELSSTLGQKPDATYKRLKRLETLNIIALQSNNRNTLVTVLNWDLYQSKKEECNNEVTTESQQNNNKVTQTRSKEIKNNIYTDDLEEIRSHYKGTKTKDAALKKLPALIKKYGKEELIRGITRYNAYVEAERNKGFKGLKYKNESTYWNGGYVDYLDENCKDKPKEIKPIYSTANMRMIKL